MTPASLILVALIVFAGALVQGMLGFGMALVAMPLMTAVLGIQVASPSFALMGVVATLMNTIRWRSHVSWRDVVVVLVPALIGVPVGVLFLSRADPVLVTRILGVTIIAYALYSLLGRALPVSDNPIWAYGMGFFSGAVSGAFNAGGPPIIAYATGRGWLPEQFKGNMSAFFLATGVVVVVSHAFSGNLTVETGRIALLALPGIYLGQVTGVYLGQRVSPARFNQVVLVVLLLLGIQLLI